MDSCATKTADPKTSFAAAIKQGWERVCEEYLSQSDLENDSQEWKFVRDTRDPQQIINVIIEMWTQYQSRSKNSVESARFATSSAPQTTGLRARLKRCCNRIICRKESGQILLHPP